MLIFMHDIKPCDDVLMMLRRIWWLWFSFDDDHGDDHADGDGVDDDDDYNNEDCTGAKLNPEIRSEPFKVGAAQWWR